MGAFFAYRVGRDSRHAGGGARRDCASSGLPKAVPEIERPTRLPAGLSGAFAAGFDTENDQFVPVDPAAVLEGADVPVAPAMSNFERKLRLIFSWAIILLAMGLTVTTQLALLLFRSVAQQLVDPAWLGGLAAAVACAVVVEGMQLWMTPMVGALVHFQRHRLGSSEATTPPSSSPVRESVLQSVLPRTEKGADAAALPLHL